MSFGTPLFCVSHPLKEVFFSVDRDTRYVATQLGLACLASSLSPDEGMQVFSELQQARKCFVLENELHVIYQVGIASIKQL